MRLWLGSYANERIVRETERFDQLETGGVLLGYWGDQPYEPVIVDATGPGGNAKHRAEYFSPDHSFHIAEIARAYRESSGQIVYLGDWHSHPGGGETLSRRDLRTLTRISRYSGARAPTPIMLIVTGPPYDLAGWMATRPKRWIWPRRIAIQRLDLQVFSMSNSRWLGGDRGGVVA